MYTLPKHSVLGIMVTAATYDSATAWVINSAKSGQALGVTALAVHGVMTAAFNSEHRYRVNALDLVVPDGQPVRWFLNLKHKAGLGDRVYGPELTVRVLKEAEAEGIPVYFYGSTPQTLRDLVSAVRGRFPGLQIAGSEASKFRRLTEPEKPELVRRIQDSGARILFVGLGCPRQEVFAYEFKDALSMPVLAVGAAFDYHSGHLSEPPAVIQKLGLQWLYRLIQEPRRLFYRYAVYNSAFLLLTTLQFFDLWHPERRLALCPKSESLFG